MNQKSQPQEFLALTVTFIEAVNNCNDSGKKLSQILLEKANDEEKDILKEYFIARDHYELFEISAEEQAEKAMKAAELFGELANRQWMFHRAVNCIDTLYTNEDTVEKLRDIEARWLVHLVERARMGLPGM